nr:hypothetical protein [Tanacetum cinerariifolium]
SIRARAVLKNGLPKIRGTLGSLSWSTTTKLAGDVNLPTGTKTSLAIPSGVQIARDTGYAVEESPLYAKQSVFESEA